MKIYAVMVCTSCSLDMAEYANLDNNKIIMTTTSKEKAINIADKYVANIRAEILNVYKQALPDNWKFDDEEDIGEMYIDWARTIYSMNVPGSLFDYHESCTIEIKKYND